MNSPPRICEQCGKLQDASKAGSPGYCTCIGAQADMRSQLDAIPTPGANPPVFNKSTELQQHSENMRPSSDEQTIPPDSNESHALQQQVRSGDQNYQDIKSQLDSIPTPGGGGGQAPARQPAPALDPRALDSIPTPGQAPSGMSQPSQSFDKASLDSIPTPGGAQATGSDTAALDAIPTPGAGAPAPQPVMQANPAAPPPQPAVQTSPAAPPPQPAAAPGGEDDWKSQLDAIPTPKGLDGTGQGQGAPGPQAVASPLPGASPGQMKPGGASGMASGLGTGSTPQFSPHERTGNEDFSRSKEFSSVDASQGYTMIFVVLILVIFCAMGYMMMNPSKAPDFSKTTETTPSSTATPAQSPTPTPTPTPTPSPTQAP